MSSLVKKSLNNPDETRPFSKGKLDIVTIEGITFSRLTCQPGWSWSECVKPLAKTDSCQVPHAGYVVSGRLLVRMDNGDEKEYGPNDTYIIPPGHDAWVIGDEPYVGVDVAGMTNYAKH